jgi:serine/threonine protein kinase
LVDYGNSSLAHVYEDGDQKVSHLLYCSPEQINPALDPDDVGYESDIFNVGSTLVYAGTGVPPWDPVNKRPGARNFKGDLFTRMTTIAPRTTGLDEDQLRVVDLMLQTNPQNRTSAADAIDLIRELLPTGASRKKADYNFVNVRSVAQRLTITQKLDKTLAKQKAAAAVQEAKKELLKDPKYQKVESDQPKSKKEVTKDVLLNRGENWWTGLRLTIWLTLISGPIGSGIRFYYLQNKKYTTKFADLDRKIVATLFGLFTIGFALPFITFEWFMQTKSKKYLLWTGISLAVWVVVFVTSAAASALPAESLALNLVALVGLLGFLTLAVLIPVFGFKSPDYSKYLPKEKKAKKASS